MNLSLGVTDGCVQGQLLMVFRGLYAVPGVKLELAVFAIAKLLCRFSGPSLL